jgi:hypothetical protein
MYIGTYLYRRVGCVSSFYKERQSVGHQVSHSYGRFRLREDDGRYAVGRASRLGFLRRG